MAIGVQEFTCEYCGETYVSASALLEVTFQGPEGAPRRWNIGHEKCAEKVEEKVNRLMGEEFDQYSGDSGE